LPEINILCNVKRSVCCSY